LPEHRALFPALPPLDPAGNMAGMKDKQERVKASAAVRRPTSGQHRRDRAFRLSGGT
jgi:hypothetical protein